MLAQPIIINTFIKELKLEFKKITGLTPIFTNEYTQELEYVLHTLSPKKILPSDVRETKFLGKINSKFRLNSSRIAQVLETLASKGHVFNFHEKIELSKAFDESDANLFDQLLDKKRVSDSYKKNVILLFSPISKKETIINLHEECYNPSKLRTEKGDRNIGSEIIEAQFSSLLWSSFDEEELHSYFDLNYSKKTYKSSFWENLLTNQPKLFNRDHTLEIIRISSQKLTQDSYNDLCERTANKIQLSYGKINNHGYLGIIIEPLICNLSRLEWQLASDLTLFSEKFIQSPLEKNYFRWKDIEATTIKHIPAIDPKKANFQIANEGLTYKDCFVSADKTTKEINFLILLFQKNHRDETLIPCPTCRSRKVQANSYPTLGVRSWECKNILCPDRSKYNRGKRYSFRALIMQQAIEDDRSKISVTSVRQWNKDVIFGVNLEDALNMLISHYSIFGDTIHINNWPNQNFGCLLGRSIEHDSISISNESIFKRFLSSSFFKRFMQDKKPQPLKKLENLGDARFKVYNEDSHIALQKISDSTIDAAITSPPYYNAREYSKWDNIYCYLHDMLSINKEIFRTLKPGAYYLYNIFDYFDNEMTTAFSLMGQKRMILSAYTIQMFRQIGFTCMGNIVWYKGDIEGKRGFNAGNFSPYYQTPFNCWEHIIIFQKPSDTLEPIKMLNTSYVLQQKPVFKMVKGKNLHGHTAPFPEEIPALIISKLGKNSTVIDPFGGSLTTGRVAEYFGIKSICIDKEKKYCELGLEIREKAKKSRKLNLNCEEV